MNVVVHCLGSFDDGHSSCEIECGAHYLALIDIIIDFKVLVEVINYLWRSKISDLKQL